MLTCPRCHKNIPDDSVYCQYCGKSILDSFVEEAEDAATIHLKENPRPNQLGRYAILLMILTIVVFDFVLGGVFQSLHWNYRIVYIISMIIYIVVILLAVFSIYVDHVDKKNGYEPSSNTALAVAAITISIVVILLNLQNIILA